MPFHFCPQCGMKLQPDFRFCPSCGDKLPTVQDVGSQTSDKKKQIGTVKAKPEAGSPPAVKSPRQGELKKKNCLIYLFLHRVQKI
uniref:Zinc-ribbon domain-containing protein n=1 Tax=Poecilia reticulata TaxID=8081 RepID=A0A3P9MW13_POERE